MADSKGQNLNVEIYVERVRLSYPYLFKPRVQENDDGKQTKKFQAKLILDKKKHKKFIDEIEDAFDDIIDAKWNGKRPAKLTDDRLCLRDGDDEDGEEFHGTMVLSASNTKRPDVRDRNKTPLVEEDGKPYAGCYVNAIVRLWAQDNKYGKRINASLEVVQFMDDGDPFGAPPVDADKKLKDFGEEDDDSGSSRRSSRRSRDEDEDTGSRRSSRRSRDDDDDADDNRSSRRSSRGGDDDDDDRSSRSSRRSRDDDDGDDDRSSRRSRRNRDDD